MSEFTIGDIREGRHEGGTGAGALERLFQIIFVGGSNPWRESDKDGWIAHDGKQPDFGACIDIEFKRRSGSCRLSQANVETADNPIGGVWRWAEGSVPNDGLDRVAWRPATPSPSQGMTPEAVRGVLRGERAEEEPALTHENAKFALVTDDNNAVLGYGLPSDIAGKVVEIANLCETESVRVFYNGLMFWVKREFWTPHPGPASAPKAEGTMIGGIHVFDNEIAEESCDENHAMKWRDEWAPDESLRAESDRERAHREEQERMRDHEKRCAESRELIRTWGTADNPHFAPAGLLLIAPIWSPR